MSTQKSFWNEDWSVQAWYKNCREQILKFTGNLLSYLGLEALDISEFPDDWIVGIWARKLGPQGFDATFPTERAAIASIFQ